MNFKTITIILGVVVASIILGTSMVSGDPFEQVAEITTVRTTHKADAELKRDAVDESWWKYENCCHSLFDRIAPAYLPGRSLGLR